MANPQEKTTDLFIVNEVYPLQQGAYKYFKGRLDKCSGDERCKSWVKYDAETYIKEHGKKVGEKIEQSGKTLSQAVYSKKGEESGFFELNNYSYSPEENESSNYTSETKITSKVSLFLVLVCLILIIIAIYKKSFAIGFVGGVLGVGVYLTREKDKDKEKSK